MMERKGPTKVFAAWWWLVVATISILNCLWMTTIVTTVSGFQQKTTTTFSNNGLSSSKSFRHPTTVQRMTSSSTSPLSSSWQYNNPMTQDLPIMDTVDEIVNSLKQQPQQPQQQHHNNNLLLEAPPGAGKTTIIPLALMDLLFFDDDDDDKKKKKANILLVEPRRVATRSAAFRMANLLGEPVGQTVGYAIRGESKQSSQTKITVVTDGVVLNQLRHDPELNGIDVVVLDEFHERGVGSDTVLALCREVQKLFRPDLKIIIMSATLLGGSGAGVVGNNNDDNDDSYNECSKIISALGGSQECRVIQSQGRQYPIEILYGNQLSCWKSLTPYLPLGRIMKDRKELVNMVCHVIIEQAISKTNGDILVFLPGAAEIRRVVQQLKKEQQQGGKTLLSFSSMDIYPLYGALPRNQQDEALFPLPNSPRRIIVSSPLAEASVTLERVTCVVDSGLRREPRCDVDTGMPRLVTVRCSKASAAQRAGRAGRVQEGLCIRIYSENEFQDTFQEHSPPEIVNTELSPTVLLLVNWGCSKKEDILNELPFVDPPNEASLDKAIQLLVELKCLEEQQHQRRGGGVDDGDASSSRLVLTKQGQETCRIPTHPRFATTFICAMEDPMILAGAIAVAFLLDDEASGGGGGTVRGSGLSNNPNLAIRVQHLFQQKELKTLLKYASRIGESSHAAVKLVRNGNIPLSNVIENLGLAVLPGFTDLVAERKGDASYGSSNYYLSLGRSARLDGIQDAVMKYIVVVDTTTGDDGMARIRSFVPITKEHLEQVAVEKDVVFAVPSRGYEVRARRVLSVGSLELSSRPLPVPSSEQVAQVLQTVIDDLGGAYNALIQNMPARQASMDNMLARLELASQVSLFKAKDDHDDDEKEAKNEWPSWILDRGELDNLLDPWLNGGVRSLKELNLQTIVKSSLTPNQLSILDKYYPDTILAPDGSKIPLEYRATTISNRSKDDNDDDDDDSISVGIFAKAKLQQFFGTMETPTVGPLSCQIPIQLQLLSPSNKLLGQTSDLPFFWPNVYPIIRSEMRGKYPKHPWPEDPVQAVATRQTKKNLETMMEKDKEGGGPETTSVGSKNAKGTKKKRRGRRK